MIGSIPDLSPRRGMDAAKISETHVAVERWVCNPVEEKPPGGQGCGGQRGKGFFLDIASAKRYVFHAPAAAEDLQRAREPQPKRSSPCPLWR
jgi:hypothetical protein